MNDFTIVLTSSVVAAALTSGVNWFIQRNNYRNEYYKKIIDKRMSTYDKVYEVMSRLQSISINSQGKKMHGVLMHWEFYESFIVELTLASLQGLWLSSKFSLELTQFSALLYGIFGLTNDGNPVSSEKMEELAAANYDRISSAKDTIRDQMMIDLVSLHDVTAFLETKQ